MTRPILVFGAGGRVGQALLREDSFWRESGRDTIGIAARDEGGVLTSTARLIGVDRLEANFLTPSTIRPVVERYNPRAVINLAACTLPAAEARPINEALSVNAVAIEYMTSWLTVPLVHISTDCVFDGRSEAPYAEADDPSPINWYGETKLRGEGIIAADLDSHIIIRTTGVYLRNKPNFLEGVLTKARAGEEMTVVADTLYTPTDARELAKAILLATERLIEDPSVSGTYHFAGPDVMSYMDFARLVAEEAGVTLNLQPTTAAEREVIEGFKRPKNAALNSDKFAEVFGLRHRPTRDCVRELVNPAS